jgi:DNA-binding response OmpR family regulator
MLGWCYKDRARRRGGNAEEPRECFWTVGSPDEPAASDRPDTTVDRSLEKTRGQIYHPGHLPRSMLPSGKRSILVVEDERAIAESIQFVLRREGFDVDVAASLREARERLAGRDLVIMDLMLPDGSGFDLLREVHAAGETAVIVVTSREEESDRVSGLEAGADDYVTKPFSPREMVARVRAVLRRTGRSVTGEGRSSESNGGTGLEIRMEERRAHFGGVTLELTRAEFDLLATLYSGRGRVFSRQQLIEAIWGHGHVVGDRTIDGHVKAVRRKLAEAGAPESLLSTVRGVGYRLED